jgi:hypothetical protein
MVLRGRIGTAARRAEGAALAALCFMAVFCGVAGAAAAQDGDTDSVTLKMSRLYNENGKGRAMVTVNNESRDTLDIDVTCEFLKQKTPVAKGSNTATRVPPFRSDTISVTSTRAQEFDSARCKVDRVQK